MVIQVKGEHTILLLSNYPCSLSSFKAKLGPDPVITQKSYNKEQTMQVNLIQSNLFNYRELESGN